MRSCADRWLSPASQLSAAGELLIDCNRSASPCVSPAFFHAVRDSKGRLTMPTPFMWNHAPSCTQQELYTQCRKRRRDDAWPADPYVARSIGARNVTDVLSLLADRKVTVVGSSVELQLELAVQCALAAADRCNDNWHHWGWGAFHDDNRGCVGRKTADEIIQTGCAAKGAAFEEMLATTDVAIIGYNPQYCFRHSPDLWSSNLRAMLPLLERFARRPGKLALLREPAAQHFSDGGSFNASQHQQGRRPGQLCACQPTENADDPRDTNRMATLQLRQLVTELAPSVRVLPFFEHTRPRHDMHPQAMCAYRPARPLPPLNGSSAPSSVGALRVRVAEDAHLSDDVQPRRPCCDCTHFCYTPLFYDATILTPLHAMIEQRAIEQRAAGQRDPAPASAAEQKLSRALFDHRKKRREAEQRAASESLRGVG